MASSTGKAGVVAPKQQIELYSGTYFGACAVGGALGESIRLECSYIELPQMPKPLFGPRTPLLTPLKACGPTHFSVAPLDVYLQPLRRFLGPLLTYEV